jgi:predicted ATP-dependent Lon-type protease
VEAVKHDPWKAVVDALDMWDSPVPKYIKKDSATVDGKLWHTITATKPIAKWIRKQSKQHWYQHSTGPIEMFDISDKIFLLLKVNWG